MILCPSFASRIGTLLFAILTVFGTLALSGCDETYRADLTYNLRDDPLVLMPFKNYTPTQFDPPGHLSYAIAQVQALDNVEDKKNIVHPADLNPTQKQEIDKALTELFGTPHQPTVNEIEPDVKAALAVDDETLAKGAHLYRRHCLHCHGLTGNGRGPTAPWVNPHPRDYRSGIFKFTSSRQGDKARKPRRQDLLRTLREGIEGTSMPSFGLHADGDLNLMASYVIHLSLRGQVEFNLMQELLKQELEDNAISERARDWTKGIADWWREAETMLIDPETPAPQDFEASVKRGFKQFQKDGMGCMSCHIDYGRQNNFLNDSWGTIVRAADVTRADYRGGRRPIDLYWRIQSGVNGANMPASPNAKADEIWDVVNFLQVLPYPSMRAKYGININQD